MHRQVLRMILEAAENGHDGHDHAGHDHGTQDDNSMDSHEGHMDGHGGMNLGLDSSAHQEAATAADAGHMGHGVSGAHGGHRSAFFWGENQVLWFNDWNIDSRGEYAVTIIGLLLLALFHEWLSMYRR